MWFMAMALAVAVGVQTNPHHTLLKEELAKRKASPGRPRAMAHKLDEWAGTKYTARPQTIEWYYDCRCGVSQALTTR